MTTTATTTVDDDAAAVARRRRRSRRRRRPSSSRVAILPLLLLLLLLAAAAADAANDDDDAAFADSAVSRSPRRRQRRDDGDDDGSSPSFALFDAATARQAETATSDPSSCQDPSFVSSEMVLADVDADGYLDRSEFVAFADAVSGGYLTAMGWTTFSDLPLGLRETFLVLSCLCELYPAEDDAVAVRGGCCAGGDGDVGMRTGGDEPYAELYLSYVCGTMGQALADAGGVGIVVVQTKTAAPATATPTTAGPTANPTATPTTPAPIPAPTAPPTTGAPTTREPTTENPTDGPTPTPSPPPTAAALLPTSPFPSGGGIEATTAAPAAGSPSPVSAGSPPAAPTTVSPSALDSGGVVGTAAASPAPSAAASAAATAPPTAPTTTRPPGDGGVDVPATFSFVASVMGEVNAEEVLAGETNQVKLTLEEQLLALCDEVIAGEGGSGRRRRRRTSAGGGVGRMLVVDKCVLATVDDVGDVDCPGGGDNPKPCLNFTNTIILHMVNETDPEAKADIFESAVLDEINGGWLADNFDLSEALEPPSPPSSPPTSIQGSGNTKTDQGLAAGAIVGIVFLVLFCCVFLVLLFAVMRRPKTTAGEDNPPDGERGKERQQVPTDIELARDGFDDQYPSLGADDSSSINTNDVSYSSQEHLLRGQYSSTADVTPMPALQEVGRSRDDESAIDESMFSEDGPYETNLNASSSLASMAAMSTLVASTSRSISPASMEEYSLGGKELDNESTSTGGLPPFDANTYTTPTSEAPPTSTARAVGMGSPVSATAPVVGTAGEAGGLVVGAASAAAVGTAGGAGGLGVGAAAAIGVASAGVIAAGAYAVTPRHSDAEESPSSKDSRSSLSSSKDSSAASSNPIDDLDSAIEAGNWGQVGALAAILASKGQSTPPARGSSRSAAASKSQDSSTYDTSLDRARAVEIDKLVDAGDWQGVVLAAARFEADQTFDGESYSASNSSRWTGSGTSAKTGSVATGDHSTSGVSNQRGQEEIRAEVEALVRRVVPEEADNINEMMTQFKGREEELVETLRRMQERAIASRARLAVQKSAKLEARVKKGSRGAGMSSGQSVASASSTKSELEQAIEAGNWQAVGAAAQKMSDSSVGDLSVDEVARLRDAISQSPAFSRRGMEGSDEDHLDQLIEQGDWQGVIAAAKRATEGPDMGELDALAQANMWQEIADQSKVEARQGPAGAGDAAAWAISRSLNALNTAEESSSQGRTIDDIADEQDSDASQYESSSYGDSNARSEEYRRGI